MQNEWERLISLGRAGLLTVEGAERLAVLNKRRGYDAEVVKVLHNFAVANGYQELFLTPVFDYLDTHGEGMNLTDPILLWLISERMVNTDEVHITYKGRWMSINGLLHTLDLNVCQASIIGVYDSEVGPIPLTWNRDMIMDWSAACIGRALPLCEDARLQARLQRSIDAVTQYHNHVPAVWNAPCGANRYVRAAVDALIRRNIPKVIEECRNALQWHHRPRRGSYDRDHPRFIPHTNSSAEEKLWQQNLLFRMLMEANGVVCPDNNPEYSEDRP